jgi:hypothetical protein
MKEKYSAGEGAEERECKIISNNIDKNIVAYLRVNKSSQFLFGSWNTLAKAAQHHACWREKHFGGKLFILKFCFRKCLKIN